MSNFWIRDSGQNTLAGVEDDPSNLPVLPSFLILEFLSNGNQKARDDFMALLPSMNDLEQLRLKEIYAFSTKPQPYEQIIEDNFQTQSNNLRVNNPNRHLPSQSANLSTPKQTLKVRFP
jgi:hypothetical protein